MTAEPAPRRLRGWVVIAVTVVFTAIDAVLPLFNDLLCAVGEYDDSIGCHDWPANAPFIGAALMPLFGYLAWRWQSRPLLIIGVGWAVAFGLWGWSTY
jgi:hypothetical protein